MACPHIAEQRFSPPTLSTPVYKEECTQCFDSQDLSQGVDVCLTCFNGGCLENERNHGSLHAKNMQHPVVLNIKRVPKPKRDDNPPPQKMAKLVIVEQPEEELYDFVTEAKCLTCGIVVDKTHPNIAGTVTGVLSAMSAKKQSEVKAWEEETKECAHTRSLVQTSGGKVLGPLTGAGTMRFASGLTRPPDHCNDCELKNNLWLCLTCGNVGCGRKQYDGSGGNGHGIAHFEATGHPVSCKLGTITPEGTADLYCYLDDDGVLDSNLAQHLATFGIEVGTQQKTEKSMAELQLEQNLKFDFSMTTEDGKQLEPLFGPGYTGLKNLGNSCYMASVLQAVFHIDDISNRYLEVASQHPLVCHNRHGQCFHCQMGKIADGLASGRYSFPTESSDGEIHGQDGIAPSMFKELIGKDHAEFSTMRQQDAGEFLQHLLKIVEMKERPNNVDPTRVFKFQMQQKLQCQNCAGARVSKTSQTLVDVPVPLRKKKEDGAGEEFEEVLLSECLDLMTAPEVVEFKCPRCQATTTAAKSFSFATFPEILVLQLQRFKLENWVPRKLVVPVSVPQTSLEMEAWRGRALQDGEDALPEDAAPSAGPAIDQDTLNQLLAMGFSENRCKRAIINTGNSGIDAATNWIFEHMDATDVDDPIPEQNESGGGGAFNQGDVDMLKDMGFSEGHAKRALRETSNNVERAVEWLFNHPDDGGDPGADAAEPAAAADVDDTRPAVYDLLAFINHKGTSVHAGHYVAHVKSGDGWALFNDNKVVQAEKIPLDDAYLLFFAKRKGN
ncbi:hypothetical protein DFJ74DRAFT_607161 [Hyaloraphidium curvatum]|nr:hypothetical protein DFJ74DRAFT_607161 [Hyaloraphidium curvatum]